MQTRLSVIVKLALYSCFCCERNVNIRKRENCIVPLQAKFVLFYGLISLPDKERNKMIATFKGNRTGKRNVIDCGTRVLYNGRQERYDLAFCYTSIALQPYLAW